MRYEGYHSDSALPIKRGQKVVIPAGVTVRSLGAKGTYVTKRAQTVTVHIIMPGQSIPNHWALGDKDYRRPLEAKGFDFGPLEALRAANSPEYYEGKVNVSNPMVTWAGAGGYWCDVDINDILDANTPDEDEDVECPFCGGIHSKSLQGSLACVDGQ